MPLASGPVTVPALYAATAGYDVVEELGVAGVQPPLGSLTPAGGAMVAVLLTWAETVVGARPSARANSAQAAARRIAPKTDLFTSTPIPQIAPDATAIRKCQIPPVTA